MGNFRITKEYKAKRTKKRRGISGCLGGDLGFLGNKWN